MSTAPATERPLRSRLSLDGKRIVLTGYSPELLEFFHGLPEARFDQASRSWSCLLTPVSAWRVVGQMEDIPDEGRLTDMAMVFRAGRMMAEHVRGLDAMDGLPEPPSRTLSWRHQKIAFHFACSLLGVQSRVTNENKMRNDLHSKVPHLEKQDASTVLRTPMLAQSTQQQGTEYEGCEGDGKETGRHLQRTGQRAGISEERRQARTQSDNGEADRQETLAERDCSSRGREQIQQRLVEPRDNDSHGAPTTSLGQKEGGGCLLAAGMGCGKSKTAIDVANASYAKTILIVCPKSVMRVWPREFGKHSQTEFPVVVLDKGSVAQRTKMAATLYQAAGRQKSRLVLVMNYDGVWREPFGAWALSQPWDLVILDESHRAKSHSSSVSKYLAKLARHATHRLCLTGTPMGNSPLDLFGQFRFLDPGVFGTSWTTFSNRYAKHQNPTIPQQITGYQNQEELQERMAWLTYRCRAEDVLDLPEKHHVDRQFELGTEGQRIYREMEEELIAEVADGVVTATNVMVKLLRLAQCTSGFLTPDNSDQVEEFDTAKLDTLQEILEDIDPSEPVVCFTRFRHDCKRIRGLAEKLGRRYGELSGSRRDALDDQAELTAGVQIAAINLQSGGLGVDLTRARYCVFYGVSFSLIEYDQALARLHRPGQRRHVTYLHLVGAGTIDVYIYESLQKRREIVDAVLEILSPKHD